MAVEQQNRSQRANRLFDFNGVKAFFEKNRNVVLITVGVVVLATVAYVVYKNLFVKPKNEQAQNQIWLAQKMFELDSFDLALNAPAPGQLGLLKIIAKYGNTPTGNLANYYAGLSFLNKGDFDKAIKHLEAYDEAGNITPAFKYAALGDAYAEKKNDAKALSNYEKASELSDTELTATYTLKKLGMFYEKLKKYSQAANAYKKLKDNYPNSQEAIAIEAMLIKAQSMAGKE